jgi:hypothetical protein
VSAKGAGSLPATAVAPEFRFSIVESYNVFEKRFGGLLVASRIFTFAPGAFSTTGLNFVPLPSLLIRSDPRASR